MVKVRTHVRLLDNRESLFIDMDDEKEIKNVIDQFQFNFLT